MSRYKTEGCCKKCHKVCKISRKGRCAVCTKKVRGEDEEESKEETCQTK